MDFVSLERYERALKKSMSACPCRWWLQRYMVLTPVNHDQHYYKPGEILDGWQMTTQDIAGLLSGGAIGIVDTRPTGISGSVQEALAQAERLRALAPQDNTKLSHASAAYYGYADKHFFRVWHSENGLYTIHNWDVVGEERATRHTNIDEVEIELAFTHLISPHAGWRPCMSRLRPIP